MKIGILSMQRVLNNGSLLQAYGLKKTIEKFGHNVEFVDFKITDNSTEILTTKERIQKFNPKLFLMLSIINQIRKFGFRGYHIAIGNYRNRQYFLNEYMRVLNLTAKPNYCAKVDILVFGSDEVFNTVQYVEQGKGHAWQLYGADNNAGIDYKNGVSWLIANTQQGRQFVEKYRQGLRLIASSFEKAAKENGQLNRSSPCNVKKRNEILTLYKENGYAAIEKVLAKPSILTP